MLKNIYNILLIAVLIIIIPSVSDATNLRGRIDGRNQYSGVPYPVGHASVNLYFQVPGGWRMIAGTRTGFNGMYFFKNIAPGYYVLQVNGRQNYPISVYNQPYQDIPPILLQY